MGDWDTLNNNEPFWGAFHDMDIVGKCKEAGFTNSFEAWGPSLTSIENVEIMVDSSEIVGTSRGESELWFFVAAK